MATDTKGAIEQAIADVQREVPALASLKMVFELELRGRGDVQLYRVQLPGPKITKDPGADAKVRLEVVRADFNEIVAHPGIKKWRQAFESGHAKASGSPDVIKLIANVVAKTEERQRTRRIRAGS